MVKEEEKNKQWTNAFNRDTRFSVKVKLRKKILKSSYEKKNKEKSLLWTFLWLMINKIPWIFIKIPQIHI